jgi:gas vesicle protein
MNDDLQTRDTSNTGSMLMALSLGALVGAGLALLLAPDSGKNTRRRLASTARRWSTNAANTLGEARNTVAELGSDAKSAIKVGQDAFLHDRAARQSRSEPRVSRTAEIAPSLNVVTHAGEGAPR